MKKMDYDIRSDLALQNKKLKKIKTFKSENVTIKEFSDKEYNHVSIIFKNFESSDIKEEIKKNFIKELKIFFKKYKLKKDATCLVVGLGSSRIASDSLGVKTVREVIATGYIKYFDTNIEGRLVYTFTPGVIGSTGIMAFDSIKALVKELGVDFVIIIDSLVSSSVVYLNNLIEINDRGITPGSGIANYQKEISTKTLGIPVLVIGVPTVTYASTIIRDAFNLKTKKITFKKGYDLIVSGKDVDLAINNLSKIIARGINKVLNPNIF